MPMLHPGSIFIPCLGGIRAVSKVYSVVVSGAVSDPVSKVDSTPPKIHYNMEPEYN